MTRGDSPWRNAIEQVKSDSHETGKDEAAAKPILRVILVNLKGLRVVRLRIAPSDKTGDAAPERIGFSVLLSKPEGEIFPLHEAQLWQGVGFDNGSGRVLIL